MKNTPRDNPLRMMKEGRFRAIRNILVGWFFQALRGIDKTERIFRIFFEFAIISITTVFLLALYPLGYAFLISFIAIHTLSWLFAGNFWVYMLDSFKSIKNPGMQSVLVFIDFTKRLYESSGSCNAILIYGSMCRRQFHIRSDLDLRIIRRADSRWLIIKALILAYIVKTYSFFIRMPVDLQVVDSMDFLLRQMRNDEYPIVVFQRDGYPIENPGLLYRDVRNDPRIVLKDESTNCDCK